MYYIEIYAKINLQKKNGGWFRMVFRWQVQPPFGTQIHKSPFIRKSVYQYWDNFGTTNTSTTHVPFKSPKFHCQPIKHPPTINNSSCQINTVYRPLIVLN